MVAGRLLLTVQGAKDLQPSESSGGQSGPAKLICKCRVGHETQWTHSKFAEPYEEDTEQDADETLDAAWNCTIPFDIDHNDQAVHLGVYAVQSDQVVDMPSRSPSILSAVGRKISGVSKKGPLPGMLHRLTSISSRRNSLQIDDRDISLRELMLQAAPDAGTPFTERREQNPDHMHNLQAAAYFGHATPCESSKGSYSSSVSGVRSNQENKLQPNGGKAQSSDRQGHELIGGVRVPIAELLEDSGGALQFTLYDKAKQATGTIQVSSRFTALVREGWLQYRPESTGMKLMGRSWKVGWFELLADGKLTWFPSPDKRHNENRGQVNMSNVQAMGLSVAHKNAFNARSYMEVLHRSPFSTRLHVLSLKSNHPDDARLWLRDMQDIVSEKQS